MEGEEVKKRRHKLLLIILLSKKKQALVFIVRVFGLRPLKEAVLSGLCLSYTLAIFRLYLDYVSTMQHNYVMQPYLIRMLYVI